MPSTKWNCKICESTFPTMLCLKGHMAKEHGTTMFSCDICPNIYYNEEEYLKHFELIHRIDENRHVCTQCGVSYKWHRFLEKHIEQKHKLESLKICQNCKEEFYNTKAYKRHIKLKHATGKKFHSCKLCARKFTAKNYLVLHNRFDHKDNGSKLFREYINEYLNMQDDLIENKGCKKCKLEYTSYVYLLKHLQTCHRKLKFYQCCQCEEAVYNTRAGLSVHLYHEHRMSRDHKCDKCTLISTKMPKKHQKSIRIEHFDDKPNGNNSKEIVSNIDTITGANEVIIKTDFSVDYIKEDLPKSLDLSKSSKTEIDNLRKNIRSLFRLLSTVPPSKLKGNFFKDITDSSNYIYNNVAVNNDVISDSASKSALKEKLFFECKMCQTKFKLRRALSSHMKKKHNEDKSDTGEGNIDLNEVIVENKETITHNIDEEINKVELKYEDTKVDEHILEPAKNHDDTSYTCKLCQSVCIGAINLLDHLTENHSFIEASDKEIYKENEDRDNVFAESIFDVDIKKDEIFKTSLNLENNENKDISNKISSQTTLENKNAKALYKCKKCKTKFLSRFLLLNHIKVKHNQKLYKCQNCALSFKVESKLREHVQQMHKNKKNLPVIKVNKNKLSPVNYNTLLPEIFNKILNYRQMFSCNICKSCFPSKELLQRHIQWEHTNNVNLHKCGTCQAIFYNIEDLEMHMTSTHKEQNIFKWKKQIAHNYEQQTSV